MHLEKTVIFISILSMTLASCGNIVNRKLNTDSEEVRTFEIDTNLAKMPEIANPDVNTLNESPSSSELAILITPTPDPDGTTATVVRKIRQSFGFKHNTLLDGYSSRVWPGAIFDGDSIRNGKYIPIEVKRGPLSLSCDSPGSMRSTTISSVVATGVEFEVLKLLPPAASSPDPDIPQPSYVPVYNKDHLMLMLSSSFEGLIPQLVNGFDFNDLTKSRILMTIVQRSNRIDAGYPSRPSQFFDSSITWDALHNALPSHIAPIYVSSMEYGRAAYILVESILDYDELEKLLRAYFNHYCSSSTAYSFSADDEEKFNACHVSACISGQDSVYVLAEGDKNTVFMDDLLNNIYTGTTLAHPISYTLSYLKNNALAEVVLSTLYYRTELDMLNPSPTPEPTWEIRVNVTKMVITYTKPLPVGATFPVEVFVSNGDTNILHDIQIVPFDSACPSGSSPITWNANCSKTFQIPEAQITSTTNMGIVALQHNTGFDGTGTIGGQNIPVVACPGVNSSFNCTPAGLPYTVKVYYNIERLDD